MIFGQTHEERTKAAAVANQEIWYAWRPVQLEDGRFAWCEYVRREWWRDPHIFQDKDDSRWKYYPLAVAPAQHEEAP